MSATISSLVSGAAATSTSSPLAFSPRGQTEASSMDPPATQPLLPSPLYPVPSSDVESSATTANDPSAGHVILDDLPRPRANSMPTSKREVSAAEARQAQADASGKGVRLGWKKRWRKIRNMFKAMRGAFRGKPEAPLPSLEKDGRGLLMVPKRKHKPSDDFAPPLPAVPAVPPLPQQPMVSRLDGEEDVGVRSAPNHHTGEPSPAIHDGEGINESEPHPQIPAIPFPSTTHDAEDRGDERDATATISSLPPNPPQLVITLDDGYVYEAFTIERAHVVFPRRSTDSTVPTVDRRRRVRRRSKTPAADDGDASDQPLPPIVTTRVDEQADEDAAQPLPSPVPTWASSESLERSAALASTLDRMLRRRRSGSSESESPIKAEEQEQGDLGAVADPRGYYTATDTESELGSPVVAPSQVAVEAAAPSVNWIEKAQDEGVVDDAQEPALSAASPLLALDTSAQTTGHVPSLGRNSISSFDLEDLAHSTPLPMSPTFQFVSSSPPASSVSLTPSDSGVTQDQEDEPVDVPHDPIFDSGTHSDDHGDDDHAMPPLGAPTSPPTIQITLDDGFAYDAFTIERAHKVFPRRTAEPGSGIPTIDRRRRVRRRSDVGSKGAGAGTGPAAARQQPLEREHHPTSVE